MEQKALVWCAVALLLLQFAECSQASETRIQNIDNQPESDNVSAYSPTTDASASKATVEELKSTSSVSHPQQPTKEKEEPKNYKNFLLSNAEQDGGAIGSALEREGKLFAKYTTKEKALFATTTKTALSTCFSATNTLCTGRKRRKLATDDAKIFMEPSSIDQLNPSLDDETNRNPEQELSEAVDRRTGKGGALTIWTTLFNTFTITTTFYIPGTTVSISGMCSLPGLGSSCFG